MEKKYKIKYLPLFYKDLDYITDYIKYQLRNEIAANEHKGHSLNFYF